MQLKEFLLISPSLEAKEVFQAIQTVITPEEIEQALKKSKSCEERKRKLPASLVVCDRNCHELVVIRFDGNSIAKSS